MPSRLRRPYKRGMRILFSSMPVFGHFLPMTPLIEAARRAGHEVVVASAADLEVEVKRLGVEFWQAGPGVAEIIGDHDMNEQDDFSPEERIARDVAKFFVPSARQRAGDLVPRAKAWQPDLVVHEPTEMAGAVAAAATGARHAVHGLGIWPAEIVSLFGPGFADLSADWKVADGHRDAWYLDILPPSMSGGTPGYSNVLPLRPTPPPTPLAGAPDMPTGHPNTVYLTLGTIFNDAPEVFRAVLDGLATLPVNVFVTAGPNADPARIGTWPSHVRVTDFVPQELVLPHCQVVVHHGGAGTMLGSLRHGLPQLILPRGADNFHNAALAQGAGAALSLTPDEVNVQAVADAVTLLLTEPEFAVKARAVREEITAMPAPDEVLAQLTT
jgi:UDP:flavonoid glycosyltransferase YjiC (YdhE family)